MRTRTIEILTGRSDLLPKAPPYPHARTAEEVLMLYRLEPLATLDSVDQVTQAVAAEGWAIWPVGFER